MEAPKMLRRQTLIETGHPIATAAAMLELYEPGDVIGSGSFGIIRKVKRKADGMVLARKELNYRKMDERDLKQLNEEVHILQNMPPHEYIVRYHERFLDKSNCMLHIVMEYCEGGDLTHVISRCRQDNVLLPEDVIWSYLTQIALALADCHSEVDGNGKRKTVVLHRDIKPENVFLSKDNVVKLGDFGLSKAMSAAAFTNTFVGTPYYMSPELIHGQQYDNKSDIWALGCLIFELCAWRPPFHQAQSQPELAKLIREGRIPSLPQGYSTALNQVVKSMLRQDSRQRPTAKQILGHEQVKFQIRSLKLRKIHDALVAEREALNAREAALAAREQAVAHLVARAAQLDLREQQLLEREKKVQIDKESLEDEKERLVHALAGSTLHSSATTTSSEASDSLFDVDELEENRQPPSSSSSINSEQEDVIKRVASRPSLVPRRGVLEERRSVGQLTRRMSSNSLMSVDETPSRGHSPHIRSSSNVAGLTVTLSASNSSTATTESVSRRRITASKSMHNLNAANKAAAAAPRQLFPSASKADLRSHFAQQGSKDGLLPSPTLSSFSSKRMTRASSASPVVDGSIGSPSKRSAAMAFHSLSDQGSPGSSTSTVAAPVRPTTNVRTSTAPPALNTQQEPKWDMSDVDNLPSPFLKKKPSVTNIVTRSTSAAQRAPPVPSRTLRPSTSRLNLANKLAIGRAARAHAGVMDDQGRLLDKKAAGTISTIS